VAAMEAAGAPERTALWAMIETPRAVLSCAEIGSAAPRLTVLVLGTNDLVKELGTLPVAGRGPIQTALSLAVLGARAAGVAVLDGVYNDVRDTTGFVEECRQGRELGFDGKTLIHPGRWRPRTGSSRRATRRSRRRDGPSTRSRPPGPTAAASRRSTADSWRACT
jgi:citrate lyase subunit beta/citryl-CoA lyase